MPFTLPKLPWAEGALAPRLSAECIQFHYSKHHKAYIDNLNKFTQGTQWESMPLLEVVKRAENPIFNQAAQAWNHEFYWNSLSPNGGGPPKGEIKSYIERDFGDFEKFKQEFSTAAAGHFGSGWAWLCFDRNTQKLKVHQTHDGGNPHRDNAGIPLLACDVWEHAYYIDYRNNRAEYIKAWWDLVNWDFANENLKHSQK